MFAGMCWVCGTCWHQQQSHMLMFPFMSCSLFSKQVETLHG